MNPAPNVSRLALFARACQHPVVLELMADCADVIDTESSDQHDYEMGAYDGSKWLALAAELRQQAASIRADDPELWPVLVYPGAQSTPQPPAPPADHPKENC